MQGRRLKLSNVYLRLLLTKVAGADKPMSAEEGTPHIDDSFGCEYDASEYTQTNEDIEMEELLFPSNDIFDIECVADTTVYEIIEASERLSLKLLTVLHTSALNSLDYKTELQSLYKHKSICKKNVRNNLDGLNLKSLFVMYQSQHGLGEKYEFHMKNHAKGLQ